MGVEDPQSASGGDLPDRAEPGRQRPGEWFPPLAGPDAVGPVPAPAGVPPIPGSPAGSGFGAVPGPSGGLGPFPVLPVPSSPGEALGMVLAGLGWLAAADLASVPTAAQAECLRGLERAQSVQAAVRANALRAFTVQGGFEDDGHGSPRTWLSWQTRITRPAASAALASMRRLGEHPAVAGALAGGVISVSWARQVCDWTDGLPEECRGDADVILLAAARGGADLAALGELAEEIRRRTARPDRDGDDGFEDRAVRLATTLGGAGRLHGDLTPRAAAALRAVLDSLGNKHGPEDVRSPVQRDHDALEEACLRLLASGCLPERAGQPVRLQLHLGLAGLLGGAGHDPAGGEAAGGGADGPGPPVPVPAAGPGDDCDAQVEPVVTGRVDHDLLGKLAARLTGLGWPWAEAGPGRGACARCRGSHDGDGSGSPGRDGDGDGGDGPDGWAGDGDDAGRREDLGRAAARELILRHAVALLSGPGGLAAWLRTGALPPPAGSVSLPLDVGAVTEIIPPHLRRAIILRDEHCAAPGCDTPPAACHVHHVVPRSKGGRTSLTNCILLCRFHHLILIHRWDWTIRLNADGTTTMTSPHGRTLHSHGPPPAAA